MTGLLDILKEAELRLNFTEVFRSPTLYENLDRSVLRERLLLSLHGLGTNTGLKRMAAGQPGTTYKDLLYVRRRFITREHLREAITRVVNAYFPDTPSRYLGRRHHGLRFGLKKVPCFGSKPHDRVGTSATAVAA
jgi:hypothetical protein